jgi:hypothetical protein
MMPTSWIDAPKDPDAIRDYSMDWSDDIGEDTITTAVFTVEEGDVVIVQYNLDDTEKIGIVRLSGGTPGETCQVKCHVVLSSGEEDEYTSPLVIAER